MIAQFFNKFKFVRKIKYDEDLNDKGKEIYDLKLKLKAVAEKCRLALDEVRSDAALNKALAEKWKNRFSQVGIPGTAASETKMAVAGPYFCARGSLEKKKDKLAQLFLEKPERPIVPNPSQWEMILSENPLTCVNAGAGSGKSTTLILRLYVMRKYMKIPWNEISVFTFSKNSQLDLMDKLIKTFTALGEDIEHATAKDVVRTFHSYAFFIERRSQRKDRIIFELVGKSTSKKKLNENSLQQDISEEDIPEVYNPLVDMTDEDSQAINFHLKEMYHIAYTNSEKFRVLIRKLFLCPMIAKKVKSERLDLIFIQTHDNRLTQYITSMFCTEKEVDDVLTLNVSSYYKELDADIFVNAVIKGSGQRILFIPREEDAQERIEGTAVTLSRFLNEKRRVLMQSDKPLLELHSKRELTDLVKFLRFYSLDTVADAPAFDYLIQGDFEAGAAKHIATRFFQLIQFVEGYGLDFSSWADYCSLNGNAKDDKDFVAAARIFYDVYLQYLSDKNFVTFNQLFLEIQPHKLDLLEDKDPWVLDKVKHVLIDEFQDINPLYANFIKAIKYSMANRTGQAGSMVAVGDDFQSIYGWKGAMVDCIIKFEEEFEAYESPSFIKMEVNHRCTQNIINFGEAIIELIDDDYKTDKRGHAFNMSPDDPLPRVFEISKSNQINSIVNFIREEMRIVKPTLDKPLRVLSRGKTMSGDLKTRISDDRVLFDTFHGSKGLEAESVILIGDCFYGKRNHIKNDVLRQYLPGQPPTEYDAIQEREVFRLAYVAATRSAKRCHWILIENNGPKSALKKLIEKSAKSADPLCEYIKVGRGSRLEPIPQISESTRR